MSPIDCSAAFAPNVSGGGANLLAASPRLSAPINHAGGIPFRPMFFAACALDALGSATYFSAAVSTR